MSTNRINKGKNLETGKLLLKKQQISRAHLGGVTGGGQSGELASAAASAIVSASSSLLETPAAAVTGPVSAALSAYDSDHAKEIPGAVKKAAGAANSWAHKHLHISF
jgi:hypothetical protein